MIKIYSLVAYCVKTAYGIVYSATLGIYNYNIIYWWELMVAMAWASSRKEMTIILLLIIIDILLSYKAQYYIVSMRCTNLAGNIKQWSDRNIHTDQN